MDIGRFAFLRMHDSLDGKVMLEDELQRIYHGEINVRISWLWDGGIDVGLGDEMNGYVAEERLIHWGYSSLASRINRQLLPAFKLREILGPADQTKTLL